jgi:hypothetical protein
MNIENALAPPSPAAGLDSANLVDLSQLMEQTPVASTKPPAKTPGGKGKPIAKPKPAAISPTTTTTTTTRTTTPSPDASSQSSAPSTPRTPTRQSPSSQSPLSSQSPADRLLAELNNIGNDVNVESFPGGTQCVLCPDGFLTAPSNIFPVDCGTHQICKQHLLKTKPDKCPVCKQCLYENEQGERCRERIIGLKSPSVCGTHVPDEEVEGEKEAKKLRIQTTIANLANKKKKRKIHEVESNVKVAAKNVVKIANTTQRENKHLELLEKAKKMEQDRIDQLGSRHSPFVTQQQQQRERERQQQQQQQDRNN